MDATPFIKKELLILVPVLNAIGALIKASTFKNKYIPLFISVCAFVFCMMYSFILKEEKKMPILLYENSIQAILLSSLSVYGHQLIKQSKDRHG